MVIDETGLHNVLEECVERLGAALIGLDVELDETHEQAIQDIQYVETSLSTIISVTKDYNQRQQ